MESTLEFVVGYGASGISGSSGLMVGHLLSQRGKYDEHIFC